MMAVRLSKVVEIDATPLEKENSQLHDQIRQLEKQVETIPQITKLLQETRQEVNKLRKENTRLNTIIYNAKFSVSERLTAIEIERQRNNPRQTDSQGRIHFCQTTASYKTGLDPKTIATATDMLSQSGFVKDKETVIVRDAEGNVVRDAKGNPQKEIYLDTDQTLREDFSRAIRAEPRKIGKDRKEYTFKCQTCLTDDVTLQRIDSIICNNPQCKACGKEVVIEKKTKDQIRTRKNSRSTPITTDTENFRVQEIEPATIVESTVVEQDDSNNPPPVVSSSPEHIATIHNWLEKRRGTPRIIEATGSLKPEDKYKTKPEIFEPNIEGFIAGKVGCIYGSWLRNNEDKTTVLCFEIDQPEYNAHAQDYLLDLARAGAVPVYWQRQRERGHLELYFDEPVDAEAARLWALDICPDLEDIPECYPCQDKARNPLSWPLYQRIGSRVYPCIAQFMLPAPHSGDLRECDPTDVEKLAELITLAVTPASLIPERDPDPGKDKQTRAGGVIGKECSPQTRVSYERDLAKQVIADFNCTHRIEDMVKVSRNGKFPAIWRGERTASVHLDRSGDFATDYGITNGSPRFIDAYELHCLLNSIDKRTDLAERCAELRRQQSEVVVPEFSAPEILATELFPTRKPLSVFGTCMVCGNPKTVQRADGAYVCESDCKG